MDLAKIGLKVLIESFVRLINICACRHLDASNARLRQSPNSYAKSKKNSRIDRNNIDVSHFEIILEEVHIISWKKLDDFIIKHPNSEPSLKSWYKILKNTNVKDFNDLRKVFNSIDQVDKFTIFNIGGNNFRLITAIHFNRQKVFIRNILTHSDYDKGKWKKEIL